jgi:hypothetical protein
MSQTKAQLIDGKSAEIEFTGGSASGPAISFTGDSNTGIYSPGADQVAVATNGTGRLFVDASGNVGVGTSSPSSLLEISSSSTPQFLISNTSNSISAGDNIGTIDYRAGSSNTVVARMAATADSANEDGAHIIFENRTGGGAFSEKARIDSSGRLLVGTSTVTTTASSSTNNLLAVESANNYLGVSFTANCNDSNGSYLVLKKSRGTIAGSTTVVQSGDEIGNIASASRSAVRLSYGMADMPGRLSLVPPDGASSPTERLRITSQGS